MSEYDRTVNPSLFNANGRIEDLVTTSRGEGSNVHVSLETLRHQSNIPGFYRHYWRMELLRDWNVIGTRTGYVAANSPSHRTFTGIGNHRTRLRVRVTFTGSQAPIIDGIGGRYSPWTSEVFAVHNPVTNDGFIK